MPIDLIHVLDSFQHINDATYVQRHTLDLIMSYGISADNIKIQDAF